MKRRSAGIRQYCRMPPYPFMVVMTSVDYDIKKLISDKVKEHGSPYIDFDMVYYADYTLLVSKDPEALNELRKHTKTC